MALRGAQPGGPVPAAIDLDPGAIDQREPRRLAVVGADHHQRGVDAAGARAEGLRPTQDQAAGPVVVEPGRRALAGPGSAPQTPSSRSPARDPLQLAIAQLRVGGDFQALDRVQVPVEDPPDRGIGAGDLRAAGSTRPAPTRSARAAPTVASSAPASPSAAKASAGKRGSRSSSSAPAATAASARSKGVPDPDRRSWPGGRSRQHPFALGQTGAGPKPSRSASASSRRVSSASPRSPIVAPRDRARRASGPRRRRAGRPEPPSPRASPRPNRRASRGCRGSIPTAAGRDGRRAGGWPRSPAPTAPARRAA